VLSGSLLVVADNAEIKWMVHKLQHLQIISLGAMAIMRSTEEILENVALLIGLLDEDALAQVQDLPFLEMAKDVSINRPADQPQFS
jgi:hypothetical protein